jgi:hypothetical protein
MLPKDRNLLLEKYKRILVLFARLNRSRLNCDIKQGVSSITEKKHGDLEKAVLVLSINIHEFDQFLETDERNFE